MQHDAAHRRDAGVAGEEEDRTRVVIRQEKVAVRSVDRDWGAGRESLERRAAFSIADPHTELDRLGAQLEGAEGLQRQLDNQNAALDVLLQAKVDVMAAIDRISADLQINLDQLQLNLDANANANVDASVGGITLTVKARTEQIKADLDANADRLLVDIKADVNLIKIVTLHTTAHVDAQRLAVSLHALVTKLRLDLSAVLTDLRVLARASVKAALAVEARLRVNITAQVNGVRAQVLAGIDGRIHLQLSSIAALAGLLNGILASISNQLFAIQSSA